MRRFLAVAGILLTTLAAGCGHRPALSPTAMPPEQAVDQPRVPPVASEPVPEADRPVSHITDDPRGRLTNVTPIEAAPGLRATVRTLPDTERPRDGGPLLVAAEDGRILLERPTGVLAFDGMRQVGASQPLLVIAIAGGGSMGEYYEAYRYDSAQNTLVRVPWGRLPFAVSTTGVEQEGEGLRTSGRSEAAVGRRVARTLWEYRDDSLQQAQVEYTPPPYPQERLGVLLLAFDTVAKRLPDETPRYFADPEQARRFYAGWVDQLPQDGFPFCAECEGGRLPAQGPVYIWATDAQQSLPGSRLLAVAATFGSGPLGPQITALTVTPMSLVVPDAAAAVALLRRQPELQERSVPTPDFHAGFWAVQVDGAGSWRVNPRTADVQHGP